MVVLYTDTETCCVWYISHWMSKRVQLYTADPFGFANPNFDPNPNPNHNFDPNFDPNRDPNRDPNYLI